LTLVQKNEGLTMSEKQKFTKEELIETIEKLESNPNDAVGILADVGITALGAAGAAAAAVALGTTTVSIPIITALTGIGIVVAAPLALIAGAAVAGGAAVYGVSRLIKDGGFHEGKRNQLLNEYQEKLRELEVEERRTNFEKSNKTRFYSFLKEPLKYDLISPDDVHRLIQAVESGHISLSEARKLVSDILSGSQISI
jgi:hypothetical protein